MKVNHLMAGGLGLWLAATVGFAAEDAAPRIRGSNGELLLDARGISLAPSIAACPPITARGEPVWAVLLQPDTPPPVPGEPVVLTDKGQRPKRETTADGIRLTYKTLSEGERVWRIGLTLDIHRKGEGEAFEVTGELRNDEPGWVVCGFTGPVLDGIQADLATHPALLAEGFGRQINRVPDGQDKPAPWHAWRQGFELSADYPSCRGCMQWCAFAGEQGGFYLGCHDAAHGSKTFCVRYDPASSTFGLAVKHQAFCATGRRWAVPPTVLLPYAGSWHTAARYYRAWSDTVAKPRVVPAWAQNASGWLLCILKQQNGEVLWDYSSLGRLCDVADERGLDMVGLFGWAHGGHDHLYPDYFPDPKMGGGEALRLALQEVRRRGKRSILYANGQLQELDTPFWNKQGKDLAVLKKDGRPVQQTYHKYHNAPAFHFGLGCLVAQAWYDRMLTLALQAHAFGADGILYDQLGVSEAKACYAAGHGHSVPAMVYEADRVRFLRQIEAHMKAINPDFIVMTEGLHDSVLDTISIFHGYALGMFPVSSQEALARLRRLDGSAPFPEMFRYTFPEVLSTVRVPTPMMDRAMANYTCTYGLRYEIESRYAPDVSYLRGDQVPEAGEYAEVINKPDIPMMRATPPGVATRYLKQMIEFQRAHADLFWRGRFTDDEGLVLKGKDLIAKGFTAGDRLGVLVWNPGDQPAAFSLYVPEATLMFATEPEQGQVEAFSVLPPQSVRMLVWRRNPK